MAISIETAALDTLDTEAVEVQIVKLRAIKNTIVGHELRKTEYIHNGLIPCIGRILQVVQGNTFRAGSEDLDKLCIQATDVICTIGHGGPSFVHPILHSTVPASLVSCLSQRISSERAYSILKCLNAVADNLPLASSDDWIPDKRLAELLYSGPHVALFKDLISCTSSDPVSHQACDAALALICKTCTAAAHKAALVDADVLTSLCERLASFIVAEGFVIPNQENSGGNLDHRSRIPAPAPLFAHLSPVLEALGTFAESSRYYATRILSDPAIALVLPSGTDNFSPSDIRRTPWGESYFSGAAVPRSKKLTPLDMLLPYVPQTEKADEKSQSSFPPLGTAVPLPKRRSSSIRQSSDVGRMNITEGNSEERDSSLLIPWLLYIVRAYHGRRRLVAGRLLVIFDNMKLVTQSRSRSFGLLLAPLLVQMLDDSFSSSDEKQLLLTRIPYVKVVPSVLSRLIEDNEKMQTIVVEAKAIPKLATHLKTNFDQLENSKTLLWRPSKSSASPPVVGPIECSLGVGGPSLNARHTMAFREGLLSALAAIAPNDDNYRTEVCNQGVLAEIMLSLEPFQSETKPDGHEGLLLTTSGNSAPTLLAACNTVRALTRSVTALRTKLVDAEVGKAVVKLMYYSDAEVRIAATKALANLVVDFSPMRSVISEPVMIKKLCEQVHSANSRLRLESLWALKNLVVDSPNNVKRDVVNELGTSWIRHLIATDPYDIPPGEVIGLVERDYPARHGRHGQITSGDVIMSDEVDDGSASSDGLNIDHELQYNRHTVEDDLAIQEQLFDLIRNLFCGANALEIVEYLVGEIGHSEFMNILLDRLKPKTLSGATRRGNQISVAPRGIVLSVLFVIVHIAASAPKFRNMLTSNTALLKQVASFCNHSDSQIRVQCCWVVINLTYDDENSDRHSCKLRASDLHKIGFLTHMRRLKDDPNSDVRERAKTGAHLLEKNAI